MLARPHSPLVLVSLLCAAALSFAEDSARDLRDQALADLRTVRDQAIDPPVLPHLRNAVTFLERSLNQFPDADHVLNPPQALDNFRQSIDSCTVAAKEGLRAGNTGLADALKADSLKLAQAARRLAATLLGEVQAPGGIIDSGSSAANAAAIQTAQDEIANGDAQLQQQDASFNRYGYSWPRMDNSVSRFKAAWIAAQGADAFLLRLLSASEDFDSLSPNGDGRREVCTLTAQLQIDSPVSGARVRSEWTMLSAGVRVRRVTVEQDAPQGTGVLDFSASLSWDGLDDLGSPAPDGQYDWQFTAILLPPGAVENPLTGSLSGNVTLDRTPPTFGATRPAATVANRRPEIGVPFADALSGIDAASSTITVEGFDRTPASARTAEGISFTPIDPFPDGEVSVVVTVRDLAETEASTTWSFRVVSALGSADPAGGGTLTVTDTESLALGASIQVPAGALAEPATLTISVPSDTPALGDIVAPTGQVIDLSSTVSTFSQDILLVIPYDQGMVDAAGIDERALEVFYYDDSAWVSITVVSRDAEANLLTIAVRHLSVFLVGYRRASSTLSTFTVVPTRLMADGQDHADITVVPRDAAGVPLGPYRTVEVRFRPYDGPPPPPLPPGGSISSVTNAGDEVYQATLTSGTAIQNVTVEAIAHGVVLTPTVSVSYETQVAALVVTAPAQAIAGAPVSLTVRAVDSVGALVQSYRGTVRLDSSDPQASFNDSTVAILSGGETTVPNIGFFQLAGPHQIQVVDASRPAILGESANVLVSPGPAVALRKVFGDFQSGNAGTWLVDPIRAQIEDAYGNAIPGQALDFEAMTGDEAIWTTPGGTSSTTLTVQSNARGEAEVFVRLDSAPGTNEVEVSFPGVDTVTFTLNGAGLVVPDAIAIAAVTPVAVGTGSEVTVTLTDGGQGVPGKIGQLTVVSNRAQDAFSPIQDNGDGTYTLTVTRNVAGVSLITATYDDGTVQLVSGNAIVGFQAPNRLTLEGPSPIPVSTPGKLTVRLFVDQTPVPEMALQLSMVSSRGADDSFAAFQVEGDGVYSVDVTSGLAGVADLQAFFDDPATPTPNDLSSNVLTVVFQTVAQGPPPPRVIESDPADGEGGVPLNKVVSVTFDRAMDTGGLTSSAFAIFGGQEVSFGFLQFRRVNWNAYNAANGETWPACGDLDGDGRDEIVLGLGTWPGSGGWLQILDDEGTGYATLGWIQLPWSAYNNVDGQVRPACGDFDGDGRDEIVVGLGRFPEAGGFLHVWDDKVAGLARLGWIRMLGGLYNTANGETRPACGDVDGDGRDEIVIGTGSYPANGGFVNILDDARSTPPHALVGWMRLGWSGYNAADGQVRPACGDVDGDGRAEIVLGTGPYPGRTTGGWIQVRDDAGPGFVPLRWIRANFPAYNLANGSTFPACGDVDGDHRAEVLVGFGTYQANGGWIQVMDGAETAYRHLGWAKVQWPAYNSHDGQTRPAAGNLRGDRVEEFIVGLGPYQASGGYAEVVNSQGNLAGRVCFHDDEEGRTVAKFTPDLQFAPNESYHIEVKDVADTQGKVMDQVTSDLDARTPFEADFSTDVEDHYLPEVLETQPPHGARDVPLNAEFRVRFNERMLGTLAWKNLIYLTVGTQTYIGSSVSLEEEGVVAVLRGPFLVNGAGSPVWLSGNGPMQLVVSGEAKDLAGNKMELGYTSSFLTLNPSVMQVTIQYPASGARVAAGPVIVGGFGPAPFGYDVELSIENGGNAAPLLVRTRVDARGLWMQPVNFLAGTYTLRARGVSSDGQLSAPTSPVTITAVSNQAAIVVTEPGQGARINVPRFPMRVETNIPSGTTLSGMQVYLDDTLTLARVSEDVSRPLHLEGISWGTSSDVPYWKATVVGMPDGRHTLIAIGGGSMATLVLTVDNTSPEVTARLEPGADLQGVLRTFPFRVVFEAEDPGSGLNVPSLKLTANDEDIHCEVVHGQGLDPAGPRPEDPSVPQKLRAIWTPTIEELAALLQKTQTNQIRACIGIFDLVGNWNEVCVEFTIDYSAGGDEEDPFPGVRRMPRSIALRLAGGALADDQGLASRTTGNHLLIEAVDLLRNKGPVSGVVTLWDTTEGSGEFVDHPLQFSVTNPEGQAAMRFVNSESAETTTIRVTVRGDDTIEPLTFTRTSYVPELLCEGSPRNPLAQEPLLVRESFGDFVRRQVGVGGRPPVWIFRAWDPGTNQPIANTEVAIALQRVDPATGLWVDVPDAAYLLPSSQYTDAQGYAEFNLEGRTSGSYRFEGRLTEFPGAPRYHEPGESTTLSIASARAVTLRFDNGDLMQLGPVASIIGSGNGQVGVAGRELVNPFELDVATFSAALQARLPQGWTFVSGSIQFDVLPGPVAPASWESDESTHAPTGTLRPGDQSTMTVGFTPQSPLVQVYFTPNRTTTHAVSLRIRGTFQPPVGPPRAASIRVEALAVGPPETALVERDGAGGFRRSPLLQRFDPLDASGIPRIDYSIEAQLPLDEPATTTGGLRTADACRVDTPDIPGAMAPSTVTNLTLDRVATGARAATYRTGTNQPIVFIVRTLLDTPTLPELPSGPAYIQVAPGGFVAAFALAEDKTESPLARILPGDIDRPFGSLDTIAKWREDAKSADPAVAALAMAKIQKAFHADKNSPPLSFDFQGVVSPQPPWVRGVENQDKTIDVPIVISVVPRLGFVPRWSLQDLDGGGAGQLEENTRSNWSPTHKPPASPGTGLLYLRYLWDRPEGAPLQMRMLQVFPDHLSRDMENFITKEEGSGLFKRVSNRCLPKSEAALADGTVLPHFEGIACSAATWHAALGDPYSGGTRPMFDLLTLKHGWTLLRGRIWSEVATTRLYRGDIIIFLLPYVTPQGVFVMKTEPNHYGIVATLTPLQGRMGPDVFLFAADELSEHFRHEGIADYLKMYYNHPKGGAQDGALDVDRVDNPFMIKVRFHLLLQPGRDR